jgi:hypothetical protein
MCAMDNEVITQTRAEREILSFDISDELLERAANTEQSGFTLAYCTSYWNSCGLPTVARYARSGRRVLARWFRSCANEPRTFDNLSQCDVSFSAVFRTRGGTCRWQNCATSRATHNDT